MRLTLWMRLKKLIDYLHVTVLLEKIDGKIGGLDQGTIPQSQLVKSRCITGKLSDIDRTQGTDNINKAI